MKSKYMSQFLGVKTISSVEKGTGAAAGGTLMITGVVVGGAIIAGGLYLVLQSGVSGEAVADLLEFSVVLGLAAGDWLWKKGQSTYASFAKSKKFEEKKLDELRTYRFVRFLPSKYVPTCDMLCSVFSMHNPVQTILKKT